MTKGEAIIAMQEGKKVTHKCFDKWEWVTIMPDGGMMSECGEMSSELFWMYRTAWFWEYGWSLKDETNKL